MPKDAKDEAVLSKTLTVGVRITSPSTLTVDVNDTQCTEPDQGKKATAIGVILDDSGSMRSNDPLLKRKDATVSFLQTLGADDKAAASSTSTSHRCRQS